jgi:hypothetical protein
MEIDKDFRPCTTSPKPVKVDIICLMLTDPKANPTTIFRRRRVSETTERRAVLSFSSLKF